MQYINDELPLIHENIMNYLCSEYNSICDNYGTLIKREFISGDKYILSKLQQYKIIGVNIGTYGVNKKNIERCSNLYIIYVDIDGNCYGNLQVEKLSYGYINWYLELFIKPFCSNTQFTMKNPPIFKYNINIHGLNVIIENIELFEKSFDQLETYKYRTGFSYIHYRNLSFKNVAYAINIIPTIPIELPIENENKNDNQQISIPDAFICPISFTIMENPVMDHEGNSYEKKNILEWLNINKKSPITRNYLDSSMLIPNRSLKNAIEEFISKNNLSEMSNSKFITLKKQIYYLNNKIYKYENDIDVLHEFWKRENSIVEKQRKTISQLKSKLKRRYII